MVALWERTRRRWRAWKDIGATDELVEQLRHGVRARWTSGPPPPFDNGTSLGDMDTSQQAWWAQEKVRLQDLGVLLKVPPEHARHVSRVFLVPKKEKGIWRMVVDLRHVNEFAPPGTAEVENLRRLPAVLEPDDHMVSLDLADGYYHFRLHQHDQRYFQFRVGEEVFQLVGLNMGWSHSPGVFTDFLRLPVQHLRQRHGGRLLWYLDDLLLMGRTVEDTARLRDIAAALFARLGLTLKESKCVWEPVQKLKHLGLVIDSVKKVFEVDSDKVAKVRQQARALLGEAGTTCRRASKRKVAQFVGLCRYLLPAVPQARFYLRALYDTMRTLEGWAGKVKLDRYALKDLHWWTHFADSPAHGGPIWRPVTTALMTTDASDFGWGGTVQAPFDLEARGFFTGEELEMHITQKELRAVTRTLQTHGHRLRHHHVRLLCDNQAVVSIINHATSRSGVMMLELRELHRLTDILNIQFQVEYIRSEDNVRADALSREEDLEDWALKSDLFDQVGGPRCTIDRFASATNARLPRFNTRWPCPGAEAVDALAQPDSAWANEYNYCNPPWTLLGALARKLQSSGAAALVVAPAKRHTLEYQLFEAMASETVRLPRGPTFDPGRPRSWAVTPIWPVDVFRIPRRAPLETCGDGPAWAGAALEYEALEAG